MSDRSKVTVARFDQAGSHGVSIRVEGAGTMQESPVIHAFAERVLAEADGGAVVVDLGACSYVDSTFLGGLVSLFKRHGGKSNRPGAQPAQRFTIYAPSPVRQSLFGTSRLDRVFSFIDQLPALQAQVMPLEPSGSTSREEMGHYIVECHRRLAEIGGAEAETFGRVADAIADELTLRRRS
jgi:anti-anti-sigma regulatory factor